MSPPLPFPLADARHAAVEIGRVEIEFLHPYPTESKGLNMTIGRLLLLFGLTCLVMVVLMHVAEAFHIFPMMGWGQPNSVGHYLDFTSAILGCILVPLGLLAVVLNRRNNSN